MEEYKYSLGFIFDKSLQKVLLIHKQKPDWQRGKINGIGGKYESNEVAEMCIRRETKEETTLNMPNWVPVGAIRQPQGDVSVWAAQYSGALEDATKGDYEEVEWFDISHLPENVMDNLRWLIPLSHEKLQSSNTFSTFTVQY